MILERFGLQAGEDTSIDHKDRYSPVVVAVTLVALLVKRSDDLLMCWGTEVFFSSSCRWCIRGD